MDDVIITITNILWEINYQNPRHLAIGFSQVITYQLTSSTSITVVRIFYFTVVLCAYVIMLYLFYIKQLFTNLFSFHFQTKDSDTYMYVHRW